MYKIIFNNYRRGLRGFGFTLGSSSAYPRPLSRAVASQQLLQPLRGWTSFITVPTSNWPSLWSNTSHRPTWTTADRVRSAIPLVASYWTSPEGCSAPYRCFFWLTTTVSGIKLKISWNELMDVSFNRWLGFHIRWSHQIRTRTIFRPLWLAVHRPALRVVPQQRSARLAGQQRIRAGWFNASCYGLKAIHLASCDHICSPLNYYYFFLVNDLFIFSVYDLLVPSADSNTDKKKIYQSMPRENDVLFIDLDVQGRTDHHSSHTDWRSMHQQYFVVADANRSIDFCKRARRSVRLLPCVHWLTTSEWLSLVDPITGYHHSLYSIIH